MIKRARAHVWVTGKVQGVFFRASTARQAASLHLDGWVRNLPDGQVEAVFEGDKHMIEQALSWIQVGPPGAVVEHVDIAWEEPQDETGFSIR
ncbi:MAG: acylphosphatase [Coriobacteriales bacterium]|nr:acylphosphatase [Actinomycetes bacterium]